MDGNTLVRKRILQIAQTVQPLLLGGNDMRLGKAILAILELPIESEQLSIASELLKVADSDQNLHDL